MSNSNINNEVLRKWKSRLQEIAEEHEIQLEHDRNCKSQKRVKESEKK